MSIVINWFDLSTTQTSRCDSIILPMGKLMVYQVNDVITKTEWCLDRVHNESFSENKPCAEIQQYLNNPNNRLEVNLQRQDSDFRHKVWVEMCKIPIGQVVTYSDIAKTIGSGARAVANACRHNAFPVIIPCHRVVAKSGLGGYMGEISGKCMDIKIALLDMESKA